ncbi:MAG: ATP synthase gamma chain [Candidatus Hepatoplasma vulgare]|nr:MAG: ATP synthase gamma chain [Candidatus Hepatoplasma sp.]
MATIREIGEKKRLIGSINKITKAMELVAISKSRKALELLLQYRSFYQEIYNLVLKTISTDEEKKDYKGTYWIVFFSDLGLAGGFNSNIMRLINSKIKNEDVIYIVGNKGETLKRTNAKEIYSVISEDFMQVVEEITENVLNYHFTKNYQIKAIYTKYISQLEFVPEEISILPFQEILKNELEPKEEIPKQIEFEPSKEELFFNIVETYVQSVLVGFYREAKVSEHTSRRIAMENATNNGEDMLRELSILYNRVRQTKITQEISEIIGGAEALN